MSVSKNLHAFALVVVLVVTAIGANRSPAAPAESGLASETADPRAADDAAIRASAERYVAAFNARDAKALAALWSEGAVTNDPVTDEEIVGPAAIEAAFARFFAEPNDARLEVTVESVEFLSPNVALELGAAQLVNPGAEPEKTIYSAVHVKQAGGWRLDRVSEEEPPVPPPSNFEQLKELAWLVGAWVDEDESAVIETQCRWSKNQNFLVRSFAATVGDQVDISGMQLIGWDPAAKQIRSWVFDSDGGFGEGVWSREGDRWVIEAKGTLPDGSLTTAVNILEKLDRDSHTWESVSRTAAGQVLPNVEKVRIIRTIAVPETEQVAGSAGSAAAAATGVAAE